MKVDKEQIAKWQAKGLKIVEHGKKSWYQNAINDLEKQTKKDFDELIHFGELTKKESKKAGVINFKKKPRMNKTESSYTLQLQALKQCGQILEYKFEGITLLLDDPSVGKKVRYTPDFLVIKYQLNAPDGIAVVIEFHETKGPHIWEDAKLKFRWARQQYPWFKFHMKQYKNQQWNEIYPK